MINPGEWKPDQKLDTYYLIQRFGGSFAKALSEAWIKADKENAYKIELNWAEMLSGYYAMKTDN